MAVSWGNWRIRFHAGILATITAVILLTCGVTLVFVYSEGFSAAEDTAGRVFSEAAGRTVEKVDSFFGQTITLVTLGAAIEEANHPITGDGSDSAAVDFMAAAIRSTPALSSAYFGYADGSFLQLISTRGDERVSRSLDAPPGTQLILRAISRDEEGHRHQFWTFLGESRKLLGQRQEENPNYDPRSRGWYGKALAGSGPTVSDPYIFSASQQPGITTSLALPGGQGVIGVDVTLDGLNRFVGALKVSQRGQVFLFDENYHLWAAPTNIMPLADLRDQSGQPMMAAVAARHATNTTGEVAVLSAQGEKGKRAVVVAVSQWRGGRDTVVNVGIAAPEGDFTGYIRSMQLRILALGVTILLLSFPLIVWLARRISGTVECLAVEAERVRHFDFSGAAPERSFITEFHSLAKAFSLMKETLRAKTLDLEASQAKLAKLVQLGIAISAERDSTALMEMILLGAKDLANADGGTLYMRTEQDTLSFQILRNDSLGIAMGGTASAPPNFPDVPLFEAKAGSGGGRIANHRNVVSHAVHAQATVNIADAYASQDFDFSGTRAFDARTGYRSQSFMTVPLKPRGGEIIGALQLLNAQAEDGQVIPFGAEIQGFVEALAAQAATAMYNRSLLDAQEKLLDAIIQILAGAIDAKSAYTGGHCERVPELAMMLARVACEESEGPLADFSFTTDAEWREFRIGAWLHDCGKVTTPEYVVDKATKLETIYNRIHEVRTRFEVLLRDTQITRLEAYLAGSDRGEADRQFEATKARLFEDFAFLAETNVGGEFLSADKIERVKTIATQGWTRHFSDRLGLGHDELKRYDGVPEPLLPVRETLLGDRPDHIIPRRGDEDLFSEANGFKVKVPEHQYNLGEVYNLSISRGTLTEEERFKINEHIIQTIVMLERLPLPKDLRRIPEYAGTHHETLVGTGYPRRLGEGDLSVPSRIMAIADIFEALTASDRPYKKAKTLSESIKILSFFKKDKHIDPILFDLFLSSGVYKDYAQRYLKPEQIDEVDLGAYGIEA